MTIVGTTIPYYLEAGFGETVVLMLHGIGGGHQAFTPQMRPLAERGLRALAWDMPGYGYSRTVAPYTIACLADACLEMLTIVDAARVILVGHSMGGMVAQEIVACEPKAVAGLVLIGTTAAFGNAGGDWQKQFIEARTAPLDAGKTMPELAQDLVENMVAPDADRAVVAAAIASMSAVPEPTYRHALAALVQFDRRVELSQIAVPTLLVAGAEDRTASPAVMEKMARKIPGAKYSVVAGAGHLIHLEQADAFNRLLLGFLDENFPDAGHALTS